MQCYLRHWVMKHGISKKNKMKILLGVAFLCVGLLRKAACKVKWKANAAPRYV